MTVLTPLAKMNYSLGSLLIITISLACVTEQCAMGQCIICDCILLYVQLCHNMQKFLVFILSETGKGVISFDFIFLFSFRTLLQPSIIMESFFAFSCLFVISTLHHLSDL